jgi:transposase
MIAREEFQRLYDQGPDAVYAHIVQMQAPIDALSARVQQLEARLGKDSHNSSKPPSSDGLNKRAPKPRSLRGQTGRSPGGQAGHVGRTLEPCQSPDQVVEHRPDACATCGACLVEAQASAQESRQVFDLPPLRLCVTEHRVLSCVCPHCHALTQGTFPPDVTQPVQYGPDILGLGVYLSQYQLLPLARTQELLVDLFGQGPSQATLGSALARAHQTLAPVEAAIKEAVTGAGVVHFDETGARVQATLQWLHVASTDRLTFYARHPKRGRQAFGDIGILPVFEGRSVHDGLSSYLCEDYSCTHSLCNAHHLRQLLGLWETTQQTWTQRMSRLLCALNRAKETAQAAGQDALDPLLLERARHLYRRIVARGLALNPAPPPTGRRGHPAKGEARSLLERLQTHEDAVLRFAQDFAVPFDNNQAERDLRMIKVHQKVSGCFRTPEGADQFCRIRGYISTLRKQGSRVLTALRSVLGGDPIYPSLQPAPT